MRPLTTTLRQCWKSRTSSTLQADFWIAVHILRFHPDCCENVYVRILEIIVHWYNVGMPFKYTAELSLSYLLAAKALVFLLNSFHQYLRLLCSFKTYII
jgi:hypothetical protein